MQCLAYTPSLRGGGQARSQLRDVQSGLAIPRSRALKRSEKVCYVFWPEYQAKSIVPGILRLDSSLDQRCFSSALWSHLRWCAVQAAPEAHAAARRTSPLDQSQCQSQVSLPAFAVLPLSPHESRKVCWKACSWYSVAMTVWLHEVAPSPFFALRVISAHIH